MTDQSPEKPSVETEIATEEETLAEKKERQNKQRKLKTKKTLRVVLLVFALTAAVLAAGYAIYEYAIPAVLSGRTAGQITAVSAEPSPSGSSPSSSAETDSGQAGSGAASDAGEAQQESAQSAAASASGSENSSVSAAQSAFASSAAQGASSSSSQSTALSAQTPDYYAREDENSLTLDKELYSKSAILIDFATNTVLAEKNPDEKIYPASMTKIMTALVASEHVENWDDTFTMTQDVIDPLYKAGASLAGFTAGETVTLRDLLYGALLPSGAEATAALAIYSAGSEEAFTELMNEKAKELGLTTAHFVNNSGLHDAEHYCTVRDMAVILRAALENQACREALSSMHYTTTATVQNPEGLTLTDKFLYRVSKKDQKGSDILGAKTGYTAEAGNCCASYGVSPGGRTCLVVTANAQTSWLTIDDHITLYSTYADGDQN